MKKNLILTVALVATLACILLPSCKNDPATYLADYKYEYYPLDTGKYLVYDVDSIFSYNSNFVKDTVHFQLMELVADTFYDNQNQLNYRLELYKRKTSAEPWIIDRVWYALKTINNVQKIEDELRFIKLTFPPSAGATWNGNLYIASGSQPFTDFQNWEYSYEGVDVPYSINGFNFDSALIVSDVADSIYTYKHLRKEVYAKHVGMVYQEWEMKTKQTVTSWDTGAWTGFSLRMRLIDHN